MTATSYISGLLLGAVCGALGGAYYVATHPNALRFTQQSATPRVLEQVSQPQQPHSALATVTAYCPCVKCCGASADGVTSKGRDAYKTRGVAVDPGTIPYGSMVTIPGAGTFLADDTGGAMRQAAKRGEVHVDIRFNNHQDALNWGRQHLEIRWE